MLWRKLFRDLWGNKVSNLAVIIVIAIGIMSYMAFSIAIDTINLSMLTFYEQGRFPDGYFTFISAPESVVRTIRQKEGVQEAEGRIVLDVRIESGFGAPSDESKYIRLHSHTENIGKCILTKGNYPQYGTSQILIAENFADANGLSLGDKIPIIASGKKSFLEICGIGQTPEYVYALRTTAQIFPDPINFSVGFVSQDAIERITGKSNITEIIYTVKEGYDQKEIEKKLETVLKNYGILRSYPKEDQLSNMLLHEELQQLSGSVIILPIIFLSVAAMILFIMIGRIVDKHRGQIGLLKAFGLSDRRIFVHYISYSIIISTLGALLGILFGNWLADPIITIYQDFFYMPFVYAPTAPRYALFSLILSVGFGTAAGLKASLNAAKLPPSEAMRSKTPDLVTANVIEKNKLLMSLFTTSGKMSLRNIFRNPSRSFFILIGIMFTFAFAVSPWNFIRMTDQILFSHYNDIEKYNVRIYLSQPRELSSVKSELLLQKYVQRAEGCLEIPSTFRFAHLKEDISIIGIEEDSHLFTLHQGDKLLSPKSNELILTGRIADKLQVQKGDVIKVKSPMFRYPDDPVDFIVAEVIDQTIGVSAYANISYLSRLVSSNDLANSVLLRCYPESSLKIKDLYKDSEQINGINDVSLTIEKMKKLIETFTSSMSAMVLISVAMGFAIIYNSYAIILSEREKEFASLLVMGMAEKEVILIVKLEQWLITALAIPLGIPITRMIIHTIGKASSNDMFTLNLYVDKSSFIVGGIITIAIIAIAQFFASLKIKNLKLSDSLKADE